VNNKPPRYPEPFTSAPINLRSGSAMVVAAALGAVAGAIAASKLSSEQFAWTGFFLVPLFLLLEILLKHVVALFGGNRDVARFTLAAAIVAGFYGAWFGLRSL
jgi:uncharacterized membrane protein YfcA